MSAPAVQQQRLACPVCAVDIAALAPTQRNEHVNQCIQKSFVPRGARPQPVVWAQPSDPSKALQPPPAPQPSRPQRSNVEPELGPPLPSSEDSPFAVLCPYPRCGLLFEASDFPTHTAWRHADAPQNYGCPICFLTDGVAFVPKSNTNLINHLQYNHVDIAMHFPPSAAMPAPSASAAPPPAPVPSSSPAPPKSPLFPPSSSQYHIRASTGGIPTGKPVNPALERPARHSLSSSTPSKSISKEDFVAFKTPKPHVDDIPKLSAPRTPKVKTLGGHDKPYNVAECLEDSDFECPICFAEFTSSQRTARLDCLCFYHEACIDQWFTKKGNTECPFHPSSSTSL